MNTATTTALALLSLASLACAHDNPALSSRGTSCVSPEEQAQASQAPANTQKGTQLMSVYQFTAKAQDGSDVALSTYKGKVLLIVNTATRCGFTPQYNELQSLYTQYHDAGLEILDFPCNQFGAQAPGSDEEIHSFCTLRFGTTFPQFSKVEVNGPGAHPLYRFLTTHTTFAGFGEGPAAARLATIAERLDPNYRTNGNIKWNFTKFLIDREGRIIARFEPTAPISSVQEAIKQLL